MQVILMKHQAATYEITLLEYAVFAGPLRERYRENIVPGPWRGGGGKRDNTTHL